jgi:hypothetical protein
METTLLYLVLAILLFQLFILVVLSFKPTNICCEGGCCCGGKKLCDCEGKKLCDCEGKKLCECEPNIMTARDMMTMKTEITQTASPENMTNTFRGHKYDTEKKGNRDYVNFLDEFERKKQLDATYEELRNSVPLEENHPNINKK